VVLLPHRMRDVDKRCTTPVFSSLALVFISLTNTSKEWIKMSGIMILT